MLAAIALTPIARWLSHAAHSFATGLSGPLETAVSLTVFVVLVVTLWELASLPAMIYLALRVDGRYSQTPPQLEEVLAAQVQATAIALPAALVAGGSMVAAVAVAGAFWWALAALVLTFGLAGALRGAPAVLVQLAEVRPLNRERLVQRLADLSRRARVPVASIDEWVVGESASTTALVMGVGRTRRVLLSSELTREWADDEIVVVVAHELAHHVYHDLWRTLALDVLILGSALCLADMVLRLAGPVLRMGGPGDLAALPLVALVATAVWAFATPFRHAQSRRQERRADVFALAMTGGADAFGAAVKRLGARLLAEERPSVWTRWLYHSHPSVSERLALADAYRRVALERQQATGYGQQQELSAVGRRL